MENKTRTVLDLNLLSKKPSIFVSTKEALKNVERVDWNDKIINGDKKVIINDK